MMKQQDPMTRASCHRCGGLHGHELASKQQDPMTLSLCNQIQAEVPMTLSLCNQIHAEEL